MAERDTPPNLLIMGAVMASVIGVTAIVVGVQQFFSYNVQHEISTKVYQYEAPFLRTLRADEDLKLSRYQWVDQGKGIVRIPVERAAELVLAQYRSKGTAPAAAPAPGA